MAILFDWYENPKTKDKQGEELTLHPRIKLNGSTTTDELRRHIQEYCSLTETDVLAVLDALSHFVGRELGEGRQVHLDGIGYFVPTLTCTEPVTLETKRKSTKVKLKNITLKISVKSGENQKIFGSITAKEIAENLKEQYKIEIDKKKIDLKEPIKVLGVTTVSIKLFEGVVGSLKVQVL